MKAEEYLDETLHFTSDDDRDIPIETDDPMGRARKEYLKEYPSTFSDEFLKNPNRQKLLDALNKKRPFSPLIGTAKSVKASTLIEYYQDMIDWWLDYRTLTGNSPQADRNIISLKKDIADLKKKD